MKLWVLEGRLREGEGDQRLWLEHASFFLEGGVFLEIPEGDIISQVFYPKQRISLIFFFYDNISSAVNQLPLSSKYFCCLSSIESAAVLLYSN